MEYQDKYDELLKILTEEIEIDGKKYYLKEQFEQLYIRSNKTAGVRLRKIMQLIRNKAQEIRDDVQEYKNSI
jgi:hypothetical protein